MIRFQKNGNTVTVVEDPIEFKSMLNNSTDASVKLANNNCYAAIEIYTRFNTPGEFAFMIKKENFERLHYGYGYDQDGKCIMIAPLLLSNNTVKFIAFIPDVRRPLCGHLIQVNVENGDVLSLEPLPDKDTLKSTVDELQQTIDDAKFVYQTAKELNKNHYAYRSELFKLANKLFKEYNITRSEAFAMAKERMENHKTKTSTPDNTKIFNKKPDLDDTSSLLVSCFKKLAKTLVDLDQKLKDLDTVEGEINKLLNRREKPVDPTPPSMQSPLLLLVELIKDLAEGK